MRQKMVILLAALLTLSGAAAMLGTHLVLRSREEAVTVEETILLGSPEAAEGLQVSLGTHSGDHLSWHTFFSPGAAASADTQFTFVSQFTDNWTSEESFTVDFYSNGFGGIWRYGESDAKWRQEMEADHLLDLPVWDVASRTGPGEERTETVDLADYYDIYPLYCHLNLKSLPFLEFDDQSTQLLTEFFRFSVPSGTMMEVTVRRDEKGNLSEIRSTSDAYFPNISSAYVDETCAYLYVDRREGQPYVDMSGSAEGYGVYRVDYHVEDVTYQPDEKTVITEPRLILDDISTVLPVEGAVTDMLCTEDGKNLLVLWEGEGTLWLSVLERGSDRLLQQIALTSIAEDDGVSLAEFLGEDLLVRLWSGTLVAVSATASGYETALTAQVTDAALTPFFSDGAEMEILRWSESPAAFDGERLALLYPLTRSKSPLPELGLVVFDQSGTPVFAARYRHSACSDRSSQEQVCYDEAWECYEEYLPMALTFS